MVGMLKFEAMKSVIETGYPTPIASIYRRCRVLDKNNLSGRHKNLIDLFEVLVKFICIIQLQEARQCIPNLRDKLPQREKTFEFLKRPSLGGWVGLLRILSGLDVRETKARWMPKISNWYHQTKQSESMAAIDLLRNVEAINFDRRTNTPNAEICNALVNYRNKQIGHAPNLPLEELSKRIPILEGILAYLLQSATFLPEITTFFCERIEVAPNNLWLVHSLRLSGVTEEPGSYISKDKLDLSELYLTDCLQGEIEFPVVPLTPFILWQINAELKRPEIYFYNDAWRTKLEYLSYTSGSYYYHHELHSGFKDLIQLKLKPGVEEDAYRFLPPEERLEHAEYLYKRAMALINQGKFEDALEFLEQSIEYERRTETFLQMAKIQKTLGEAVEAIHQTLQNCLDLDPNYEQALTFRRSIDEISEENMSFKEEINAGQKFSPSIWQALTPRPLREYAALWWIAICLGWYVPSASLEFLAGRTDKGILNALQFICVLTGIIGLISAQKVVARLRLPLSLQLDSMRLERFERWFESQIEFIFGSFIFHHGKLSLSESLQREKFYYWGGFVYILLIGISGIIITELYKFPTLLVMKRFIDNILVVGIGAYPFVRYMITITLFVYHFSQLSIKPMLTKINDDGLRAFGPLITFNIFIISIIWITLFGVGSLEVTLSWYGDFFLVGIGSVVFMVWSIGMPLAIRRAARQSKSKAVHAYSEHIEKAFKSFLEDPADDTLNKYQWLLKNQITIKKIATWPLSWSETLFVAFGSNLILLVVDAWYIIMRLGYWPEVITRIRGFL